METFGQALRRWREAAGLSQPQLARRIPISQASLSRWEHDKQSVDPAIARRLDELLGAGGALEALRSSPSHAHLLDPDECDRLARVADAPRAVDRRVLDSLATILAAYRTMEDTLGAPAVFEPTRAALRLMERIVIEARGPIRASATNLAAQWAQFTGWLHTAMEQRSQSEYWFDRTLEWAIEAGNVSLQANALSYKGHLAWIAQDAGRVIGLSQAAQRNPAIHLVQLTFDAMQEARGHAMVGDIGTATARLSLAEDLLADARIDDCPPWSYYYSPAFWKLQRGLIHGSLGRSNTAVDLLALGLAELPSEQRNAEWTEDYRRALETARAAL
jgi:transcriptional regulator with XRE-family HTH domain